jgi:sugar phosphate isomerase/epimerase
MTISDAQTDTRPSVGLEHLTFAQESLEDFISAAATGGAETICLNTRDPLLLDDHAIRRETRAQLDALGLSVAMGDGFLLIPDEGLDGMRRQCDLAVEFGASLLNACAFEPDEARVRNPASVVDLLGGLCRIAREADLGVVLEFTPLSHVPSLAAATQLLQEMQEPNLRILVDTLHLARAGEGPADLAKVDTNLIGYCQICDGPRASGGARAYLDEAINERAIPGQGELPLEEVLALLPRDIVISAEVPLRSLREEGLTTAERARRIIEPSRDLLARAWA